MVLILGLKHQYVNVAIRAWQEKYPFLSGRRQDERDETEPTRDKTDTYHRYTQSKRETNDKMWWREKNRLNEYNQGI